MDQLKPRQSKRNSTPPSSTIHLPAENAGVSWVNRSRATCEFTFEIPANVGISVAYTTAVHGGYDTEGTIEIVSPSQIHEPLGAWKPLQVQAYPLITDVLSPQMQAPREAQENLVDIKSRICHHPGKYIVRFNYAKGKDTLVVFGCSLRIQIQLPTSPVPAADAAVYSPVVSTAPVYNRINTPQKPTTTADKSPKQLDPPILSTTPFSQFPNSNTAEFRPVYGRPQPPANFTPSANNAQSTAAATGLPVYGLPPNSNQPSQNLGPEIRPVYGQLQPGGNAQTTADADLRVYGLLPINNRQSQNLGALQPPANVVPSVSYAQATAATGLPVYGLPPNNNQQSQNLGALQPPANFTQSINNAQSTAAATGLPVYGLPPNNNQPSQNLGAEIRPVYGQPQPPANFTPAGPVYTPVIRNQRPPVQSSTPTAVYNATPGPSYPQTPTFTPSNTPAAANPLPDPQAVYRPINQVHASPTATANLPSYMPASLNNDMRPSNNSNYTNPQLGSPSATNQTGGLYPQFNAAGPVFQQQNVLGATASSDMPPQLPNNAFGASSSNLYPPVNPATSTSQIKDFASPSSNFNNNSSWNPAPNASTFYATPPNLFGMTQQANSMMTTPNSSAVYPTPQSNPFGPQANTTPSAQNTSTNSNANPEASEVKTDTMQKKKKGSDKKDSEDKPDKKEHEDKHKTPADNTRSKTDPLRTSAVDSNNSAQKAREGEKNKTKPTFQSSSNQFTTPNTSYAQAAVEAPQYAAVQNLKMPTPSMVDSNKPPTGTTQQSTKQQTTTQQPTGQSSGWTGWFQDKVKNINIWGKNIEGSDQAVEFWEQLSNALCSLQTDFDLNARFTSAIIVFKDFDDFNRNQRKNNHAFGSDVAFILERMLGPLSQNEDVFRNAPMVWIYAISRVATYERLAKNMYMDKHQQASENLDQVLVAMRAILPRINWQSLLADFRSVEEARKSDSMQFMIELATHLAHITEPGSSQTSLSEAMAVLQLSFVLHAAQIMKRYTFSLSGCLKTFAPTEKVVLSISDVMTAIESTITDMNRLVNYDPVTMSPAVFLEVLRFAQPKTLEPIAYEIVKNKWLQTRSSLSDITTFLRAHLSRAAYTSPQVFSLVAQTAVTLQQSKLLGDFLARLFSHDRIQKDLREQGFAAVLIQSMLPNLLFPPGLVDLRIDALDPFAELLLQALQTIRSESKKVGAASALGIEQFDLSLQRIQQTNWDRNSLNAIFQQKTERVIEITKACGVHFLTSIFMENTRDDYGNRNTRPPVIDFDVVSRVLNLAVPAFRWPDLSRVSFLAKVMDVTIRSIQGQGHRLFFVMCRSFISAVEFLPMLPIEDILKEWTSRPQLMFSPSILLMVDVVELQQLMREIHQAFASNSKPWMRPLWLSFVDNFKTVVRTSAEPFDARIRRLNSWWIPGAQQEVTLPELSLLGCILSIALETLELKNLLYKPASFDNLFHRGCLLLRADPNEPVLQNERPAVQAIQDGFAKLFDNINDRGLTKAQLQNLRDSRDDITSLQRVFAQLQLAFNNATLSSIINDQISQFIQLSAETEQLLAILSWLARQPPSLSALENKHREIERFSNGMGTEITLAHAIDLNSRLKSSLTGLTNGDRMNIFSFIDGEESRLFSAVFQYHLSLNHTRPEINLIDSVKVLSQTTKETLRTLEKIQKCELPWMYLEPMLSSFQGMDVQSELSRLEKNRPVGRTDAIETIKKSLEAVQSVAFLRDIKEAVSRLKLVQHQRLPGDDSWAKLNDVISKQEEAKNNEEITMRVMTEEFGKLQGLLAGITVLHLQFLKALNECDVVLNLFREFCPTEEKFSRLRPRLNVQLQHDRHNSLIFNSVVSCHYVCVGFVPEQPSFQHCLNALRGARLDENIINNLKNVKANAGIVQTWLSGTVFSASQHALLRVRLINQNGEVEIKLGQQSGAKSTFVIRYRFADGDQENHKHQELNQVEIEDHERQLTFHCKSMNQDDPHRAEAQEHLDMLEKVRKLVDFAIKLEQEGHPEYQQHTLRQDQATFQLTLNKRDLIDRRVRTLESHLDEWQKCLDDQRIRCPPMLMFSSGEISNMLVLLRPLHPQEDDDEDIVATNETIAANLLNATEDEIEVDDISLASHLFALYLRSAAPIATLNEPLLHQRWETLVKWFTKPDDAVRALSRLLMEMNDVVRFDKVWCNLPPTAAAQQHVVELSGSVEKPSAVFLTILNLCQSRQRVPSSYEILWCEGDGSNLTNSDLELFFKRVAIWRGGLFFIVHPDLLNPSLQKVMIEHSRWLCDQEDGHGELIFITASKSHVFSHVSSHWLRPRATPNIADGSTAQVLQSFRSNADATALLECLQQRPSLTLVNGINSFGKTHFIKHKYLTQQEPPQVLRVTVNDKVDRLNLARHLVPMTSQGAPDADATPNLLIISVSFQAELQSVNRLLFDLLVLGAIRGEKNGLICSLPAASSRSWQIVVEWPNEARDYGQLASLLAKHNEKIDTIVEHPLVIGTSERLVASLLALVETANQPQNVLRTLAVNDTPLQFPLEANDEKCRQLIERKVAADMEGYNRLHVNVFVSLLYRRARFFQESLQFLYNQTQQNQNLGFIMATQMLSEVKELMKPMFPVGTENSPLPAYVVYDSSMSPKLLSVNWNNVNNDLGRLLGQPRNVPNNPRRMWEELLTWAFNVNSVDYVTEVFEAFQFVLVPDYAYRLIFVHERKLSRLPLVIESDTGVGKTFLLQVYSGLLNQQVVHDRNSEHFPRVISRLCLYLRDQIKGVPALKAAFDGILAAEAFGPAADNFKFTDVFSLIRNLITQLPREQHVTFIQKLKAHIHQLYNQFLLLQRDDSFELQIEEEEEDEAAEFDKVLNLAMKLASLPLREVFFRLLIHPGVTEADMKKFMVPIIQLAEDVPHLEPVVFFDEVNTASILGLFKEMLIDRYMVGQALPPNIFFIAAINPFTKETAVNDVATAGIASLPASVGRFNVHELPSSLKQLRWHYGPLDGSMLRAYIEQKIQSLRPDDPKETLPFKLDNNACQLLTSMLFEAHRFFITRLGPNAVSQRDLQRVFKIMQFFWRVSPINDRKNSPGKAVREAVLMAIAAVYYFRLPMREEAQQFMADGRRWPLREEVADLLTQNFGSQFSVVVKDVIDRIIDARNFFIPAGIALNQALKENMICTLISICTKVPGSIIGKPGTSKTLSFQLVAQNMKGEMSQTDFCKLLPRVDPFFCQCSEDSTPEDISTVLDQAIDRQKVYDARNENTQAVVFMDEAGLPSKKRMVLKVLHQYLDECRVSFIAISNEAFDPANANRMMQVVRSTGSIEDTLVLALGCLGLTNTTNNTYHSVAKALCEAWSNILAHPEFNKLFHHRDFIYMMRHLQRESGSNTGSMFTPIHVLQALERNFSGISKELFRELVDIVFGKIRLVDPSFTNTEATDYRNSIQLLKQALGPQVMPDQRNGVFDANTRIRPRFKLVLDPTGDDSGSGLLFDFNLLDQAETEVIHMSDFVDDNRELYRVELLSKIKNCMEVGRRILLVRASPLHGSLYDVFNQNFTTVLGEERDGGGVYSMIAIGARTEHCLVHPKFECIVHLRTSDLSKTPAPFLSRFEKYLLDIEDFYYLQLNRFNRFDQEMIHFTRQRCEEFVNTIGINNFYGIAKDTSTTMATLLLSHMDTSSEQPSFQPLSSLPDSVVRIMEFDQHADAKDSFVLNVRALMFKLIQLLPAEAVVVKLLPSTTNAKMFARLYFQHQEHFGLEAFSDKLTSTTAATAQKLVVFTRANSSSLYLSQVVNQWHERVRSLVTVIEADGCQQQQAFVDKLTTFVKNVNQRVVYVVINATTQKKTVGHVSYIRQLIDDTINASTKLIAPDVLKRKTFALVLAFPPQSIYSASCYPSVFLCGWQFHFFDSVFSGGANYIRRFADSFCSDDDDAAAAAIANAPAVIPADEPLAQDVSMFNKLLKEALFEFCSQVRLPRSATLALPTLELDRRVKLFYDVKARPLERTNALFQVLQSVPELWDRLLSMFHSTFSRSGVFRLIHSQAKSILLGQSFLGLADEVASTLQRTLHSFLMMLLHDLCSDYGVESLVRMTADGQGAVIRQLLAFLPLPDSKVLASFAPQSPVLIISQDKPYRLLFYRMVQNRIKHASDQARQIASPDQDSVTYIARFFENMSKDAELNQQFIDQELDSPFFKAYLNDLIEAKAGSIANTADTTNLVPVLVQWLVASLQQPEDAGDERPKGLRLVAQMLCTLEVQTSTFLSLLSAGQFAATVVNAGDQNLSQAEIEDSILLSAFDKLWRDFTNIITDLGLHPEDENQRADNLVAAWMDNLHFLTNHFAPGQTLPGARFRAMRIKIDLMMLAAQLFLLDPPLSKNALIGLLTELAGTQIRFHVQSGTTSILLLDTLVDRMVAKDVAEYVPHLMLWYLRTCTPASIKHEANTEAVLKWLQTPTLSAASVVTNETLHRHIFNLLAMVLESNTCREVISRTLAAQAPADALTAEQLVYVPSFYSQGNQRATSPAILQSRLADYYCAWEADQFSSIPMANDSITLAGRLQNLWMQYTDLHFADLTLNNPETVKNVLHKAIFKDQLLTVLVKYLNSFAADQTIDAIVRSATEHNLPAVLSSIYAAICDSINGRLHLISKLNLAKGREFTRALLSDPGFMRLLTAVPDAFTSFVGAAGAIATGFEDRPAFMLSLEPPAVPAGAPPIPFPHLYAVYAELHTLMATAAQSGNFAPLLQWCHQALTTNKMSAGECHMLLLLETHHEYLDQGRLPQLRPLAQLLAQNDATVTQQLGLNVQPLHRRALLAFLDPAHHFIEFTANSFGQLFSKPKEQLGWDDQRHRHILANVLALTLGTNDQQHHMWTHIFKPILLPNTFGFGSVYNHVIGGVHYDCGTVIFESGQMRNPFDRSMKTPSVYLAIMLAYAALCWAIALDNPNQDAYKALQGPVLTTSLAEECAGATNVAKLTQFVFSRVSSGWYFLADQNRPKEDLPLMINRAMERYAWLCRDGPSRRAEFKPTYNDVQAKIAAETVFSQEVYYQTVAQLAFFRTSAAEANVVLAETFARKFSEFTRNARQFEQVLNLPSHTTHISLLREYVEYRERLHLLRELPAIFNLYDLIHRSLAGLIDEAENDKPVTEFLNSGRMRLVNDATDAQKIIKEGVEAFNRTHTGLGGVLRGGACATEDDFAKINAQQTPIRYLLSNAEDDRIDDVLYQVMRVLVDIPNKYLVQCERLYREQFAANVEPATAIQQDRVLKLLLLAITRSLSNKVSVIQATEQRSQQLLLTADAGRPAHLTLNSFAESMRHSTETELGLPKYNLPRLQQLVLAQDVLGRHPLHIERVRKPFTYRRRANENAAGDFDLEAALNHNSLQAFSGDLTTAEASVTIAIDSLREEQLRQSIDDLTAAVRLIHTMDPIPPTTTLKNWLETEAGRADASWCPPTLTLLHFKSLFKHLSVNLERQTHLFVRLPPLVRVPLDEKIVQQINIAFERLIVEHTAATVLEQTDELLQNLNDNEDFVIRNAESAAVSHSLIAFFEMMAIEDRLLPSLPNTILDSNFSSLQATLLRWRTVLRQRLANQQDAARALWNEAARRPTFAATNQVNVPTPETPQQPATNQFTEYLERPDEPHHVIPTENEENDQRQNTMATSSSMDNFNEVDQFEPPTPTRNVVKPLEKPRGPWGTATLSWHTNRFDATLDFGGFHLQTSFGQTDVLEAIEQFSRSRWPPTSSVGHPQINFFSSLGIFVDKCQPITTLPFETQKTILYVLKTEDMASVCCVEFMLYQNEELVRQDAISVYVLPFADIFMVATWIGYAVNGWNVVEELALVSDQDGVMISRGLTVTEAGGQLGADGMYRVRLRLLRTVHIPQPQPDPEPIQPAPEVQPDDVQLPVQPDPQPPTVQPVVQPVSQESQTTVQPSTPPPVPPKPAPRKRPESTANTPLVSPTPKTASIASSQNGSSSSLDTSTSSLNLSEMNTSAMNISAMNTSTMNPSAMNATTTMNVQKSLMKYLLNLQRDKLLDADRLKKLNAMSKTTPTQLGLLFTVFSNKQADFMDSLSLLETPEALTANAWIFTILAFVDRLKQADKLTEAEFEDLKQRLRNKDQGLQAAMSGFTNNSSDAEVLAALTAFLKPDVKPEWDGPAWVPTCGSYLMSLQETNQLTPEQIQDIKQRLDAEDFLLMIITTHLPVSTNPSQTFLQIWQTCSDPNNAWIPVFVKRLMNNLAEKLEPQVTEDLLQRAFRNDEGTKDAHETLDEDDDEFVELYTSYVF